jgi:hypothetical protein
VRSKEHFRLVAFLEHERPMSRKGTGARGCSDEPIEFLIEFLHCAAAFLGRTDAPPEEAEDA